MSDTHKNTIRSESPQPPENRKQPPFHFGPFKLVSVIVSSAILLGLAVYISSAPQHPSLDEADESLEYTKPKPRRVKCHFPTTRYDIRTGQAACYPSSGGVWMTELNALKLQHLNIDRFVSTERSPKQEEEDAFCQELRRFGGDWYSPESERDLWFQGKCDDLFNLMPTLTIHRQIGFPENGGVWVLTEYPSGFAIVENALTMEERCQGLERLGAVYCEDIAECSPFDDISKDPRELVEEYGNLPPRMNCDPGEDDWDYEYMDLDG